MDQSDSELLPSSLDLPHWILAAGDKVSKPAEGAIAPPKVSSYN